MIGLDQDVFYIILYLNYEYYNEHDCWIICM